MPMRRLLGAFCLVLAVAAAVWAAPVRDPTAAAPVTGMTAADHVNLERNLRWMLARERAGAAAQHAKARPKGRRVGVMADAGVWHLGARSIAGALEGEGWRVEVLDRSRLCDEYLVDLDALVLPGGWAPFQRDAAEREGLAAISKFVTRGGRCLAICAGAYLLSARVRWQGDWFPYPVGLFDGEAHGPVPGLAEWPAAGAVRVAVSAQGRARGLGALSTHDVMYYGGGSFSGGTEVQVLAEYPDGTPAIVSRKVGRGELVLSGVHVERDPRTALDASEGPAVGAGRLLGALLGR
ncbi:MAG: BPL-N domain-containing protein [Planctomycetota bacterium]|nr:BPL-N domain-containing protein [Planctomycetota bacterium]